MDLKQELIDWLDQQTVTSENIGDLRRQCFMPWDSKWNGIVRDETAAREVDEETGRYSTAGGNDPFETV